MVSKGDFAKCASSINDHEEHDLRIFTNHNGSRRKHKLLENEYDLENIQRKRHKANKNTNKHPLVRRMSQLEQEMLLLEQWEKEQDKIEQEQIIQSLQLTESSQSTENGDEDDIFLDTQVTTEIHRNITTTPEDKQVVAELKKIAKSHITMKEAVLDLSQRLPFQAETNLQIAQTMMKHINDTEDDVDLMQENEYIQKQKIVDEDDEDDDMDMMPPPLLQIQTYPGTNAVVHYDSDDSDDSDSSKMHKIRCHKDGIMFSVNGNGNMKMNEFKLNILKRIREVFDVAEKDEDDDILIIDNIVHDRCIYMERTLDDILKVLNFKRNGNGDGDGALCLDDLIFEVQEKKKVLCKFPDGKVENLRIFRDDFCFELKTKIREFNPDYAFSEIDLVCNNNKIVLKENNHWYTKKWDDYKSIFKDNMVIDIKYNKCQDKDRDIRYQLFVVNLCEQTVCVDVNNYYLVEDLKCLIFDREAVPMNEQRLLYDGTQLQDGKKLTDYGNMKGSKLDLCLR